MIHESSTSYCLVCDRVPNHGVVLTAKEILQAQYARGEITREQYELRKQDTG